MQTSIFSRRAGYTLLGLGVFIVAALALFASPFIANNPQATSAQGILECSPTQQTVVAGQPATISVEVLQGPSAPDRYFVWEAVGGSPSAAEGYGYTTFTTTFSTPGTYNVRVGSLTVNNDTEDCQVIVQPASTVSPTPTSTVTPTPTPTITPSASPTPTVTPAVLGVDGLPACATGSYSQGWIGWNGASVDGFYAAYINPNSLSPATAYGKSIVANGTGVQATDFSGFFNTNNQSLVLQPGVTYYAAVLNGHYSKLGTNQASLSNIISWTVPTCATPTPSATPTPTPTPTPVITPTPTTTPTPGATTLTIAKTARNITIAGTEAETVTAKQNDIVEFIFRIQNVGSQTAQYVTTGDNLPSGIIYIPGTTSVNGVLVSDGITTTSIALGNLQPNGTYTVRFNARVTLAGPATVTNVGAADANNAPWISDTAQLVVTAVSTPTPTPTPTPTATPTPSASPTPTPATTNLSIAKTVRNVSTGSSEVETVSADPNNVLEFFIRVTNTGSTTAKNTVVGDNLPSRLTYIANSTRINGVTAANGITTTSIPIGDLAPGATVLVQFNAQVAGTGSFAIGTTTMTNLAAADADNAAWVSDTAVVVVTKFVSQALSCSPTGQTVRPNQNVTYFAAGGTGAYTWSASSSNHTSGTGSSFTTSYAREGFYTIVLSDGNTSINCFATIEDTSDPDRDLDIDKLVRNITDNTAELNSVNADPNEMVEFIIRVTNDGNQTAQNVIVSDSLPNGLIYQNNTTTVNGASYGNGIVTGGLNIGSLAVGQTKTIRFKAQVKDASFFVNNVVTTLTNIAFVSASNFVSENDAAFVQVYRVTTVTDNDDLRVLKFARNLTKGETIYQSNITARPGDALEFKFFIRSYSDTTLHNVIVRDVMPNGLIYLNNTTSVNGVVVADGIISGGINIGSLAPGQEVVILFNGKVAGSSTFNTGTTVLTNVAVAKSDELPERTGSMTVTVTKGSVLGTVTTVSTGASSSLLIALMTALACVVAYALYTRTALYRRGEALALGTAARKNSDKFNFAL